MLFWGVWGFADKNAVFHAHPFTVQWMYSLPYVLSMPLWYWLGQKLSPATNHSGAAFAWAVLASIASMLAFLLLLFALEQKPASIAVAITSAYPVITLILCAVRGLENFSPSKFIGVALIGVGIIVLQMGGK